MVRGAMSVRKKKESRTRQLFHSNAPSSAAQDDVTMAELARELTNEPFRESSYSSSFGGATVLCVYDEISYTGRRRLPHLITLDRSTGEKRERGEGKMF